MQGGSKETNLGIQEATYFAKSSKLSMAGADTWAQFIKKLLYPVYRTDLAAGDGLKHSTHKNQNILHFLSLSRHHFYLLKYATALVTPSKQKPF